MQTIDDEIRIRKATPADAQTLAAIEAACFPAAEAATRERFDDRLTIFADHFLILEIQGEAAGFIDGMVTQEPRIEDRMYEDAGLHRPDGAWQSVFGLNVLPQYRRRGCAARLLEAFIALAEEEGRRGLTLTCKEHMLHYYAKFGFVPLGMSASQHGGVRWFDMVLEFQPERTLHKSVKAVFFDLDGTLVDSVPRLTEGVNRVMRHRGRREFSEDEIARMVGKGARILIECVCEARNIEPTTENVQSFLQEYADAIVGGDLPPERFYPGAEEAVAALHDAGIKTVLVTNKMRTATEFFLEKSGLNKHLDAVVTGDDTDHPKPAPDMLLLACNKAEVLPQEAVMVGDSENDALAARAAGLQAMLVTTGYNGGVPMAQWAARHGFPLVFDSVAGIKDYLFACAGLFSR